MNRKRINSVTLLGENFKINWKPNESYPWWESEYISLRPINDPISPYGFHVHIKDKKTSAIKSYYAEGKEAEISSFIVANRMDKRLIPFLEKCLEDFKKNSETNAELVGLGVRANEN